MGVLIGRDVPIILSCLWLREGVPSAGRSIDVIPRLTPAACLTPRGSLGNRAIARAGKAASTDPPIPVT